MTVVIDPVANYVRRGRPMRAAHLLSDRLPPAGTIELLHFASAIGLKPSWIQRRGGAHEHFDLMGRRIQAAIAAGAARIDRYRLIEIVQTKRAHIENEIALFRCGIHPQEAGMTGTSFAGSTRPITRGQPRAAISASPASVHSGAGPSDLFGAPYAEKP